MANLPPGSTALGYTPPSFDQGLGRTKKGVDFKREGYVLGTLGADVIFTVAAVAANQANTTAQAFFPLPGRLKISKIAVFCSAIASVAGTHSFNIVVGNAGAYTQGNVPGNDNSAVPPVGYNAIGQASGSPQVTAPGGGGIASNPAVVGQALFAADIAFNTTNFPTLATGTGTGNVSQIFIPSSPDAVYGNGSLLTLRVTTPVTTGSISNLIIAAYLEPQPLNATWAGVGSGTLGQPPQPGVDF